MPYHIFRMSSTPEDQAKNFIDSMSSVHFNPEDRFVISATIINKTKDDPEKHTNVERAGNLLSLMTMLEEKGYKDSVIYCSPELWNQLWLISNKCELASFSIRESFFQG